MTYVNQVRTDPQGRLYFVDHNTKTTTYQDPRSSMLPVTNVQQPIIVMEDPRIARAKQIAEYFGLTLRYRSDLVITVVEARNLDEKKKGSANPYCKVVFAHNKVKV